MPKRRKTLAELDKSGTLRHNLSKYQGRINALGVVSAPIGPAPRHFPPLERSIWVEIVRIAPPNLLTKSDRLIVEVVVRLVAKMRTANELKTSDLNALSSVLAKIGLSPLDRLKMSLEPIPAAAVVSAEDKAWAELDELD